MKKAGKRNAAIIACLVVQLCVGILYLWSAFKGNIISAYGPEMGWTPSAANLISSFMLFAYVLGCLFGGFLNDKKGPKITCFAGIILFTGGVALSALARSITLFTLTYAILAGLGSGFGNAACISCIQKWLPHKRGLASGLACAAFGLSTVVFTPFSNWLMNIHRGESGIVNFTPVFLTLAVVFAALGIGASLFVSLPDEAYINALHLPKSVTSGMVNLKPSQVIRTSTFWALFFTVFFINGTWNLCVPVIKDLGMQRGLSEALAIACVSFTGMTNAAGRLIMSSLSDKLGRSNAMYVLCGITFLGAVLLTFIGGTGYFATIALIAFAYGGPAPLFAALSTDLFGPKNSGTNLGLALLALGFSSVFFNFISGSILHSTVDNMTSAFIMGAITAVIPVFLMLYINRYIKTHRG